MSQHTPGPQIDRVERIEEHEGHNGQIRSRKVLVWAVVWNGVLHGERDTLREARILRKQVKVSMATACGCRVEEFTVSGLLAGPIIFCPLHAHAPAMREEIERLRTLLAKALAGWSENDFASADLFCADNDLGEGLADLSWQGLKARALLRDTPDETPRRDLRLGGADCDGCDNPDRLPVKRVEYADGSEEHLCTDCRAGIFP